MTFHSLGDSIRYLQGERLVIEPKEHQLGDGKNGDSRQADFHIRNLSNEPITLLGANVSCDCVTVEKLPLTVSAHGRLDLHISFHYSGTPGTVVAQTITYTTQSPSLPRFSLRVQGRIID